MSIDFRGPLPAHTLDAGADKDVSAPLEDGPASFAGRLQGALAPTAALRANAAVERGRRRTHTPAHGIDRTIGTTRSVPHVDVSQVSALPLPSANVPCAPRFDGVSALLSHPVRLSLTSDADGHAPPRDRAPNRRPEADASAQVEEPDVEPTRARTPDAAVSQAAAALVAAPAVTSDEPRQQVQAGSIGKRRVASEAPASLGPSPQALAARLAKTLAARAEAGLTAAPTLNKPQAPHAQPADDKPSAAPPSAAPAASRPPSPSTAAPVREPLPQLTSAAFTPRAARPSAKPASAPPPAQAPPAPTTSVAEPPTVARPSPPPRAAAGSYLAQAPAEPALPSVRWQAGEAHVSVKTDAGDLSLHVRVKDGLTEVAAAGPGARYLRSAGSQLQAQLSKEGLLLGRFATQVNAQIASLDDGTGPLSRQDPDEDDGTASAEGDEQRLISGKGRSRSLRRLHVKA